VALIGQRTQELHRRREVAVLICGVEVLKRPCLCFAEQGERENAASQESCDLPFHSAHATDTKRRAEGGVLGPSPSARAVKRGARPASDPASVAESRRARIDMGQRPGFSARFGFHSSSSVTCTQRSMLTIANRKRDPTNRSSESAKVRCPEIKERSARRAILRRVQTRVPPCWWWC